MSRKGSKNKLFHPNDFIVDGEITTIDIKGVFVLFDTKHLNRVKLKKWFFDKRSGYCFCNVVVSGVRRTQHLHKFITEWYDTHVDHIDCDKLNNLETNLRKCTHQQNMVNKINKFPKFRGVSKLKNCKTFSARIVVHQVTIRLGNFKTEVEAALAYNKAALTYFGEFARLNGIEDLNNIEFTTIA